jgi:Protein of unknown function (DUF1592)/Protein of unknown function (DUF1588)/Protein of unknown function (DUF1585)
VGYSVKHQESSKSRHFYFVLGLCAACVGTAVGCSGTIRGSGADNNAGDSGNNAKGGSDGNRTGGTVGSPGSPGSRLLPGGGLRRLPVREIEATLDTIFPELKSTRTRFPPDGYAVFDNEQKNLDNGLAFLENAALVMGTLVDQARTNTKVWARVRTCPANGTASVCMERFYNEWAPRILRRAGNDVEAKAYLAIATRATELGGVDDALAVGLEAMLRQPDFFHRVELGEGKNDVRTLTQSELLGRLSFFLWGEAPDDALRSKADSEDLTNDATRATFAKAMLEDPRAERQIVDYHAQWLGFSTMPRDGIKLDMWNESAALVRRVVFEKDLPYEQLLLSDETYLTPALAKHYQMPTLNTAGWAPNKDSGRLGILGHGTFLSAFANVGDTSPVKRGKNVLNRLLCIPIELPKDLVVNADAMPEEGQCRIDFFRKVHSAGGSCKGCHESLDGIGFGLDTFDRNGVRRTNEMGRPECKLDGIGSLDGTPFTGPAGLSEALAEHPDTPVCVAEQIVRFYLGTDPRASDESVNLATILSESFEKSQHHFQPLLLSLVKSPEFALVAPR